MTLIIDLVPHLDAGDMTKWQGDQNVRPLSELGRRQAAAIADALGEEQVDALYSSPALRCRQSLEPLAERFGLGIEVLAGLGGDEAWRPPDGWGSDAEIAAHAAGRAFAALAQARREHSEGRLVACSHGQIIPALVAYLIAAYDLVSVARMTQKGQWYRLRFEGDDVGVELREAEEFPR